MSLLTTIAVCIARWLYEQASAILQALRAFVEMLIAMIDAQILALRAIIAMLDLAKFVEEQVWSRVEAVIDQIRNALMAGLPGPGQDLCPEFYAAFSNPALALLEAALAAFMPYKDRWLSFVSLTDRFDQLLTYWTATKQQLLAMLDVIDDALYQALMDEAHSIE